MLDLIGIFTTIFVAELGDKTQIAALLLASSGKFSPWAVFIATAGALVAAAGLAVLVGSAGARYLEFVPLKLIAGIGFILLGLWQLFEHFKGA